MGRVLALQLDAPTSAALRSGLSQSGDELHEAGAWDGVRLLEGRAGEIEVVVIGTAVEEPVRTAQRIFVAAPRVPVVVLTEPEKHKSVSDAARIAPFVSKQLRCLAQTDPGELVALVREMASRARKALSFSETVQALNAQLATAPAPVPPPAVLGGILDNAPIGVVVTDSAGTVYAWNRRASELLERSEKAALGMRLDELFTEPAERERWRTFRLAFGDEKRSNGAREIFRRRRGDRVQHLEVTKARLGSQAGHSNLLFIFQDVSDRVEALEQLREAVRVRDDFLSIASHELRTPLTPLQLHVQGILHAHARGEPIPDKLLARVETIARQVVRMDALISSLLDVSRMGERNLRLECEDLDLSQLAHEVVARFQAEADQSRTPLVLNAPEPVPGRWDRVRLDQVLSNLVGNALKFGAGKPVEVRVDADPARDVARLRVRDHGPGIAAEDQSRIFGRFERAVSSRQYGGFGLGLWIVRQIVDALGGTIEVHSELGDGALFTVELPCRPAPRTDVA